MAAELKAAAEAFGAGAFADAMKHVTAAWSAAPAERLGPIAVAIDRRLQNRELPAKVAAGEDAWLELARSHDPSTLPTLLVCDWPIHPRAAKARLSELVEFPPDPRIADAIIALLAAKRYLSNASVAFWRLAFLTLANWGEPRIAKLGLASRRKPTMRPPLSRSHPASRSMRRFTFRATAGSASVP